MARTTEQKAMTKGAVLERAAVDRILDSAVSAGCHLWDAERTVAYIRQRIDAHIKRTSKKGNEGGLGRN